LENLPEPLDSLPFFELEPLLELDALLERPEATNPFLAEFGDTRPTLASASIAISYSATKQVSETAP